MYYIAFFSLYKRHVYVFFWTSENYQYESTVIWLLFFFWSQRFISFASVYFLVSQSLLPDYQRLLSSMPSRRLNTSKLLENGGEISFGHLIKLCLILLMKFWCAISSHSLFWGYCFLYFAFGFPEYFQNKLVDTIHFMEILNLKDSVEKDTFFRKLPNLAEQLPRQIVLKKVWILVVSIYLSLIFIKLLFVFQILTLILSTGFYSCFLY